MAATNYSPIQLYYSTTASTAPTAGNLVSGELAINITDGILFYKDNAGAVQTLATKAGTSGTYTSITLSGGTANGVAYLNGSKVVTTGSALTFNGTQFSVGSVPSYLGKMNVAVNDAGGEDGYYFNYTGGVRVGSFTVNTNTGEVKIGATNTVGSFFNTFYVNNAEAMRLTSTGLGIGTSSPGAKLDVVASGTGYVMKWSNAGTYSTGYLSGDTNGVKIGDESNSESIYFNYASNYVGFNTLSTERMRLDSSGNLGIGTSSPVSATGYTGFTVRNNTNGGIIQNTDGTVDLRMQLTPATSGDIGTYSNHPVRFVLNGSEQMRLTSTGLGIGTSSPAYKLDVSGQGRFAVNGGSAQIRLERTTSNAGASWIGADDTFLFQVFNTGFSQKMGLDINGNLGLGVTPSAWNTSWKAIQVGANSALTSQGSVTDLQYNTYRNTSNIDTYISSDFATRYRQISGTHTWSTAAAGTAGNAITFTQAMTLDSSGNLGIGTSSPGYKLDVQQSTSQIVSRLLNTNTSGVSLASQLIAANNGVVNYQIDIDGTGANFGQGALIGTTTNHPMWFRTNNTTQLTLSASGNLGLGVTPSAWSGFKAFEFVSAGTSLWSAGAGDARLSTNTYYNGGYKFAATGVRAGLYNIDTSGTHSWNISTASGTAGNAITFTQTMTLNSSGAFLLGATSTGLADANYFYFDPASGYGGNALVGHVSGTSSGVPYFTFAYNGSSIGTITQSGTTAVAYNTSSDYRLKNITGPITNSGSYIDSLNPVEGTWKADGSVFVGLIAHEVQEASRTQIATGVKDGEEMQGMDYSSAEIIANLIAEVKSLRQRLAQAGI